MHSKTASRLSAVHGVDATTAVHVPIHSKTVDVQRDTEVLQQRPYRSLINKTIQRTTAYVRADWSIIHSTSLLAAAGCEAFGNGHRLIALSSCRAGHIMAITAMYFLVLATDIQ
eukprot:scpid52444/ scgid7937/ 